MTYKVDWHGPKVKKEVHAAAMEALAEGAEHILRKSGDLVPWDTGTLQRSGTTVEIQDGYIIGYNTPYAVVQHENLAMHHKKPGATAKYLENPFNALKDTVLKRVAAAVDKVLK